MLTELENGIVQIEPSDWRWGASIVGFIKYIEYHKETEKVEIEINVQRSWKILSMHIIHPRRLRLGC